MRGGARQERSGPYLGWGTLQGNHHGPADANGRGNVLRSTWQIVHLDNGMMPPPRFNWGLRLWIYASSGRCWNLDLGWRSYRRYKRSDIERERLGALFVAKLKDEGAWPIKFGNGGPDVLGVMLGANGLGIRECHKRGES